MLRAFVESLQVALCFLGRCNDFGHAKELLLVLLEYFENVAQLDVREALVLRTGTAFVAACNQVDDEFLHVNFEQVERLCVWFFGVTEAKHQFL